jgi:hypothetical protein
MTLHFDTDVEVVGLTQTTAGFRPAWRREKYFRRQMSIYALLPNGGRDALAYEVACLRVYATDAVVTACLWWFAPPWAAPERAGWRGCGSGRVTGSGYNRGSAAAQRALTAAGVRLNASVSGQGYDVVADALLALARYLAGPDALLVPATANP